MQALLGTVITTGHSGSKSKSKFAETDQQLAAKSDRAIARLRSTGRDFAIARRCPRDATFPSSAGASERKRVRLQIVSLFSSKIPPGWPLPRRGPGHGAEGR